MKIDRMTRSPRLIPLMLIACFAGLTACSRPVRLLPMFDGATGEPIEWQALLDRAENADVVFVGEEHDDETGHAVEQAIVEDAITQLGGSTGVSMEMLERDEQPLVDAYLAGDLDLNPFIKQTESYKWGKLGLWNSRYQPMIETAKDAQSTVIAANAPRAILHKVSSMSFGEMHDLPEYTQGHFETPLTYDTNLDYRRHFLEVMNAPTEPTPVIETDAAEPTLNNAADPKENGEKDAPPNPHAGGMTYEQGVKALRSQMIWDASMAGAIADALNEGTDRIVHIVGRFHVQNHGGTVSELEARTENVATLTVILVGSDADELRDEDRNIGDIVIYTAKDSE